MNRELPVMENEGIEGKIACKLKDFKAASETFRGSKTQMAKQVFSI